MPENTVDSSSGPIHSNFASDPEMAELVELFVSELPVRVEAIRVAFAEGREEDLRGLAHQLKGAAGGYGFGVVSVAAAAVETPLRTGAIELDSLRPQVDELVSVCGRVTARRAA